LWEAGRDDSPEALVLDHRWALLHRLPGADPGGGGIVWEARELNDPTQTPYVVKTVSGDQVDRRTTDIIQQLHNLRHERRAAGLTAAGGLASEHIGEIIAQGDDRGFYYLVYPLYRPGSLARHCDRLGPRQTLPWSAQVVYEVLSALVAASDEGLVHLDIKPGNIVMDGERARVIDWGLSRVWTASPQSTWRPQGSPFYACPEVVLHPSVPPNSPLADLYSVGATFYWLLTGEAPLERDSPRSQDYQAYRELLERGRPPRPVRELVAGIPRPVSDLIDCWLRFDPAQRVPAGTPPGDVTRVARDELAVLLPALPETAVGRVTARRRWGRRLP
jgi:serine/threonine protein kinase